MVTIEDYLEVYIHGEAAHAFDVKNDYRSPLDKLGIKQNQGIFSALIYYAQVINNKLILALRSIESHQSSVTKHTLDAITQLLDYVSTYPNGGITYHASIMTLTRQSDVSSLN